MVRTDLAEHAVGAVDLALLALEQRDLFAVFADAREIEAEVRLDRLLAEIKPGEASADELGDAGGDAGVEDSDPEQKARDLQRRRSARSCALEIPHRMIENETRLVAEAIAWMV